MGTLPYELKPKMGVKMSYRGNIIHVLGAGSFIAIINSGHSNSHASYFLSTDMGIFLLLSDVSRTWKGWELGVESGWIDNRNQGIDEKERYGLCS